MLLITLAALLVLGQAPPLTKAEQLQEAARKGDAATVRKLIDEGVDVNTRFRYKNLVIVQCDIQRNSFLAAFDTGTGKEVWRTVGDEIPSWSTPPIFEANGRAELVTQATGFTSSEDGDVYVVKTGPEYQELAK